MFSRSKAWAVGLLAATFIAGLFLGGGTERLLNARESGQDGSRRHRQSGWVEHLADELDLRQEQQDSIRTVINESRTRMRELWSEVRPAFDSIRSRINEDIGALLDTEQQIKFEELLRHAEERRQSRRNENHSRSTDSNVTTN